MINGLVWVWVFIEFNDNVVLMGMVFLVYSFGLCYVVDVDYIVVIDNVICKLM